MRTKHQWLSEARADYNTEWRLKMPKFHTKIAHMI